MVAAIGGNGKLSLIGLSDSWGAAQLGTPSGAIPFPRIGIQMLDGAQIPTTSPEYALCAQWSYNQLGHPYYGMPGITRQAIIAGIKGTPRSGLTAVQPIVFQYDNFNDISYSNPSIGFSPQWVDMVSSSYANWICYQLNASGALAVNAFDSAYGVTDWAVTSTYGPSVFSVPGGLTLPQWIAQYLYNKYQLGTYESDMAAPNLDGYMLDVMDVRCVVSGAADWLRNGTNQGETNATAITACCTGKAAVAAAYAALDSTRKVSGNTSWAYGTLPTAQGGLNLNGAPLNHAFASPQIQNVVGNQTTSNANFCATRLGFATAMAWYIAQIQSSSDGSCLISGQYSLTDYAQLRQDTCFTLMNNGYMLSGASSAINTDGVDPATASSFCYCDEFWGGSLQTSGYLGPPISGAQGLPQESAWSNGVYRRDFANGIALANSTTSSQTVSLGGTFYHLRSVYGSQSINNGAAITSITLPGGTNIGEACILLRTAPP